jgi:uncharacterized membrane protein
MAEDLLRPRDAPVKGPEVAGEVVKVPRSPAHPVLDDIHGVIARTRVGRRVLAEPALVVLTGAIVTWMWVFGLLVWRRHDRFGTFDFDLGHHDQAIWLLAHGKGFDTVSGMPVLGHHATLAYFALAPFYWLGAGPQFINFLQVTALAVAAVPIYLFARDRLASAWLAVALAVAWLLNPSVQWLAWETWHPETMAIPFLLFAYLMASQKRWVPYWVLLVVAMSWKEDVALAVGILGLVFMVRGQRRVGAATCLVGLLWFGMAYGVLMPHFNGGTNQAGIFYGEELGRSPTDIAKTAVTDPGVITARLSHNDALGYARDLLAPWGFVPFAAPLLLVVAVPQFFANVLAIPDFFFDIRYHYVAIILVVLALGTVEGASRMKRPGLRRGVVGLVVAAALATSAAWGVSPIGTQYRRGYWPLGGNARQATLEAAVATPPGRASVAATYSMVPHLSHRNLIYSFPNPWIARNWGVAGVAPHDPDSDHLPGEVDWLVLDRTIEDQNPAVKSLINRLLTDGEFQVVSQRDGVVVARRVAPPPGG